MIKTTVFKRIISIVLALVLTLSILASCDDLSEMTGGSIDRNDETGDDSVVLTFYESIQDNETMPFTITEKAKTMLSENENLFLENSYEGLEEHIDTTLEYRVLTKNIDKHGDKLLLLEEAYVVSIDETEFDDGSVASELQLMDADENDYYCISLCAHDDVFEGDIVSVCALPIGETSFENIGGGTTLAIMLASCYIEKIES